VEITDLVVPEVGDDLAACRELCQRVYDEFGELMPIHFLRWHPDYKMLDLPMTPIKTLEKHYAIAREVGLKYAYLGNVHGHPLEDTHCHGCGRVVVDRWGFEIRAWHLTTKGQENFCNFCGTKVPIKGPLNPAHREERFFGVV
jgi:pyruvate formate lyase activating enzyme